MAKITYQEAAAFVKANLRPANTIEEPLYFGLHIGPPGSGKTHILGTLPGRTLVIDCRDGASGTAPLVPEGDRIDVVPVTNWDDMRKVIVFLGAGEHDYQSVGLDGLAKLQQYDLRFIIENTTRKDGTTAVKMELDMWGTAGEHMITLINRLEEIARARRLHVAVTCWESEVTDDDGALLALIPSLQGKISKNQVAGMFDVVCYHVTRDGQKDSDKPGRTEFWALSQPHEVRKQAKCRWRRLKAEGSDDLVQVLDPLEFLGDGVKPARMIIAEWIDRIRAACEELAEKKGVRILKGGELAALKEEPAPAAPAPAPKPAATKAAAPRNPAAPPAPAPVVAAPVAAPVVTPENAAAAEEFARSAEETTESPDEQAAAVEDLIGGGGPSLSKELRDLIGQRPRTLDVLKEVARDWYTDALEAFPSRQKDIVEQMKSVPAKLGGAGKKLGDLDEAKLIQALEALVAFEYTNLRA